MKILEKGRNLLFSYNRGPSVGSCVKKVFSFSEKCLDYFENNIDSKRTFSDYGLVGAISKSMHYASTLNKGFGDMVSRGKKNSNKASGVRKSYRGILNEFTERYGEGSFEWVLSDGLPHFVYVTKDKKVKVADGLIKRGTLYIDNKHSFYVGRHPLRNSTRPQKFSIPNEEFMNFCIKNSNLFDVYELDYSRCVVNRGCWHTNKHTLQAQLVPVEQNEFTDMPSMKTLKKFKNAIRNSIRKLNIVTLHKRGRDDMLTTSLNRDTYPGFHYEAYLKRLSKADSVLDAMELAYRRWDRICSGPFSREEIYPSIYTIGARNKRDYTYDDGELAASRVVHMPEMHVEITSGVWTDAITEHMKEVQSGPVFIGNSLVRYERLKNLIDGTAFQLEGDWSKFDSTLYLNVIIAALGILRCYFELNDDEIDRHFIAIFDSVGIKDYYTPGGHVYRAIHGLPSGVKSTNLLGSVINLIVLNFCVNSGANKNFSFAVGGDDFLITAHSKIENIESLQNKIFKRAEQLGMRLKFLKIKDARSTRLEDLPCFYKYVVKDSHPMIPIDSMLERVFMPWNKTYNSLGEIVKFLFDVMPSLGTPSTHLMLYYFFYAHIRAKIVGKPVNVVEIVREHIVVYNKMMKFRVMPEKISTADVGNVHSSIIHMLYIHFKKSINDQRVVSSPLIFEQIVDLARKK